MESIANSKAHIGVGFGRWSPQQPGGTPDKVPLTNIAFIDGKAVPQGALHPGYIIKSTGVEVGLTLENVQEFASTKLQLTPNSPGRLDWQAANVSLAVDKSHWNYGSALFDTGIHQSYLRLDPETTAQLHTTQITDGGKQYTVLTSNSTVHMRIGNAPDYIAYYEVTVGDTRNVVRPYWGEFRTEAASPPPPFINTGRYSYRGFDVMLDAECGWFGLRWKGSPGQKGGGQYFATALAEDQCKAWRQ